MKRMSIYIIFLAVLLFTSCNSNVDDEVLKLFVLISEEQNDYRRSLALKIESIKSEAMTMGINWDEENNYEALNPDIYIVKTTIDTLLLKYMRFNKINKLIDQALYKEFNNGQINIKINEEEFNNLANELVEISIENKTQPEGIAESIIYELTLRNNLLIWLDKQIDPVYKYFEDQPKYISDDFIIFSYDSIYAQRPIFRIFEELTVQYSNTYIDVGPYGNFILNDTSDQLKISWKLIKEWNYYKGNTMIVELSTNDQGK